jgi:acetyltransferase-like isoleucine patch superfamily enzyme
MKLISLLKKKISFAIANSSSNKRVDYIRKQGGKAGINTTILSGINCFGTEPYLVEVGDNCLISSNVSFITHDGSMNVLNNLGLFEKPMDKMRPIKVGDNCFIGTRVIIMPGVKIGNNCIVGAGSVVTKDVPDAMCVAGVPAKVICSIYEYADKNKQYFYPTYDMDAKSKKQYLLENINLNS